MQFVVSPRELQILRLNLLFGRVAISRWCCNALECPRLPFVARSRLKPNEPIVCALLRTRIETHSLAINTINIDFMLCLYKTVFETHVRLSSLTYFPSHRISLFFDNFFSLYIFRLILYSLSPTQTNFERSRRRWSRRHRQLSHTCPTVVVVWWFIKFYGRRSLNEKKLN